MTLTKLQKELSTTLKEIANNPEFYFWTRTEIDDCLYSAIDSDDVDDDLVSEAVCEAVELLIDKQTALFDKKLNAGDEFETLFHLAPRRDSDEGFYLCFVNDCRTHFDLETGDVNSWHITQNMGRYQSSMRSLCFEAFTTMQNGGNVL